MGYTIYILEKDKDKRKDIKKKLSLLKEPWGDTESFLVGMGKEISYVDDEHEPFAVGFDYSSWISGISRKFIWTALVMIAEKYGKDCIYYDGEDIPINDLKKHRRDIQNLKPEFKDKSDDELLKMVDEIEKEINSKI